MHELARYLLENLFGITGGEPGPVCRRPAARRAGRAACASLAAAASWTGLTACGGDAIDARPDTPPPTCAGCVVVDNPVLEGDGLLLGDAGERSERRGDEWRWDRFELLLGQTVSVAGKGSEVYPTLRPWPAAEGVVAPASGGSAALRWEAHGARVGYEAARYSIEKSDAQQTKTEIDARTELVLDPEVILVPVRGVRTVPDYAGAPDAHATEDFTREALELVLDDAWRGEVYRTSHSGTLDSVVGVWTTRTTGAPGERRGGTAGFETQRLPDDLFRECGIQFRLVDFIEVEIPFDKWEMVNPYDRTAARCGIAAGFALSDIQDEAPLVEYPSIYGVYRLLHPSCPELTQYDILERAEEKAAYIVTQNLREGSLLLAHELGHVLGAPDDDGCLAGAGHLMCHLVPFMTTTIEPDSCAPLRRRAARYANAYFGTTFPEQ